MSQKQRVAAAISAMELRTVQLIERAELLGKADDPKWQRQYLLEAARAYASSVNRLSRIRALVKRKDCSPK